MAEKITMKEQIKTLNARMICKADLIADYMNKGMTEIALIELWALQECLTEELNAVIKYIPDKIIK